MLLLKKEFSLKTYSSRIRECYSHTYTGPSLGINGGADAFTSTIKSVGLGMPSQVLHNLLLPCQLPAYVSLLGLCHDYSSLTTSEFWLLVELTQLPGLHAFAHSGLKAGMSHLPLEHLVDAVKDV